MIGRDLGLRAVIQDVELLVFTSNMLPLHIWSESRYPLVHVLFNEHKLDNSNGQGVRLMVFELMRSI